MYPRAAGPWRDRKLSSTLGFMEVAGPGVNSLLMEYQIKKDGFDPCTTTGPEKMICKFFSGILKRFSSGFDMENLKDARKTSGSHRSENSRLYVLRLSLYTLFCLLAIPVAYPGKVRPMKSQSWPMTVVPKQKEKPTHVHQPAGYQSQSRVFYNNCITTELHRKACSDIW
ncbi:hypothetical protein H671_2g7861 [Cricetulus griseus]|nr:hypothetical protein H671_2g7861 [Cricetulus griseus]